MSETRYGNGFARAYDALTQEDYSHKRYADYIESVFLKFGRPPEPIIADLGCGTGSLCVELDNRGYDIIGIDNSPQMLAEARRKAIESGARDILFLEQDLDAIELFGTVGAFVSTIDVINHLTDKRGLRRLFRLIDNYLAPGGLFIFDLNTEYKLSQVIGGNFFFNVTDDICWFWSGGYEGKSRISRFDLTFFTRGGDGRWQRHDETLKQRAYSIDDIKYTARDTGLEILGAYDFLSFRRPAIKATKINCIIQKSRAGVVNDYGSKR